MLIVAKEVNANGARAGQKYDFVPETIPDGYVAVPTKLEAAAEKYLPWLGLEFDGEKIVGVFENTEAKENFVPEEAETEDEPSAEDDTAAMLVDHEYRLTLLELGITDI